MGRTKREAVRIIRKLCEYGYQAPIASDFNTRLRRNVCGIDRRSTKADAWNAILIAILTTQQQSGRLKASQRRRFDLGP